MLKTMFQWLFLLFLVVGLLFQQQFYDWFALNGCSVEVQEEKEV
jgi:hypothetical protein